jgi:hypothetical protein
VAQACNVVSAGAWTRTEPSATTGRWASGPGRRARAGRAGTAWPSRSSTARTRTRPKTAYTSTARRGRSPRWGHALAP